MADNFKKGFLKTLWILREYLPVIILGGGWAPLVYYHYLIKDKSKEPIRTKDIDLFVKSSLPVLGDKTIDQLLEAAGLKANFKSFTNPPVIHYEGHLDKNDVEVEFLTNMKDSFGDLEKDGVAMIISQRPPNAFPELNDEQFKQYVFGKFQRFISLISN